MRCSIDSAFSFYCQEINQINIEKANKHTNKKHKLRDLFAKTTLQFIVHSSKRLWRLHREVSLKK